MSVRRQRSAGRVAGVAALALGGLVGCFQPDFLAYAPCDDADACARAGLSGCLKLAGAAGVCTLACADDSACPDAIDGDATPHCAAIADEQLCVLSCMDDETCPEGQACTEVEGVDGGAAWLCLPEAT